MTDQDKLGPTLDRRIYEKASGDFIALKSRLPEAALERLAREVVARLSSSAVGIGVDTHEPGEEEIEDLCRALVSDDGMAGARIIEARRRDGATVEEIYLAYLGRAARRLGEWWDDDTASFAEVTIGTSRIYAIMRAIRREITAPRPTGEKSAVFASVPSEDHTLGVTMAADLFRQRGWHIDLLVGLDHDALIAALSRTEHHLLGLSASRLKSVETIARLVVAVRVLKPGILIMVAGNSAETDAETLHLVGVDATATRFEIALAEMERLWKLSTLPFRAT